MSGLRASNARKLGTVVTRSVPGPCCPRYERKRVPRPARIGDFFMIIVILFSPNRTRMTEHEQRRRRRCWKSANRAYEIVRVCLRLEYCFPSPSGPFSRLIVIIRDSRRRLTIAEHYLCTFYFDSCRAFRIRLQHDPRRTTVLWPKIRYSRLHRQL